MNRHWTPQETNRLLFYVGTETPSAIARRLGRSPYGVMKRYRRLRRGGITRATITTYGMSTLDCATALGTNPYRVTRWIYRKWLKASRHIVHTRKVWVVTEEALERFLYERGALLNGLEPTSEWAEIVGAARQSLHSRYINSRELADLLCLSYEVIAREKKRMGFPLAAFSLQGHEYWYERAAVRDWLRTAPARYRTPHALRAFGLED